MEEQACSILASLGFAIVDRNYYTVYGEIDCVADHPGQKMRVFFEIRSLQASKLNQFGDPAFSITKRKLGRMRKAALSYLGKKNNLNPDYDMRFDLMTLIHEKYQVLRWIHYENISQVS